ncbi:50S ribosomal protein L13 [Candidatus Gracilibacteria bacterium]|nr:50S ribosomal protein L13 [Candidatus Gracilibacteria bacterium]
MKTLFSTQISSTDRPWFVVDAAGKSLGRISTLIARKLSGRDRVDFTAHIDNGAYVVIVNAAQVAVSGKKETEKIYYSHSQYLGGLKETNLTKMRAKNPAHILEHAIKGMLPKNKLQAGMLLRLRVIPGPIHQYEAQKPQILAV